MSLRFRLNLLITLLFALILILGAVLVIHNARRAVYEEIQSTANLTLQLIEVAFASASTEQQSEVQTRLVEQISHFERSRHLDIELRKSIGTASSPPRNTERPIRADAPRWFVHLVAPEPLEFKRTLSATGIPFTEIIVQANPSDEITEAWKEARGVLGLLLLFILLANGLVFFTIGRALQPIDAILKALDGIEQGDYRSRLPTFNLPELDGISQKFNHMAEVLQQSREENRYLTQHSLAIQEAERRHLARELHDELGQSISAIKAVAVSLNNPQNGTSAPTQDRAQAIISFSTHMYDVVSNMMRRLRPVVLDELGLVAALQDTIDDWNAHHEDVFCRFRTEGALNDLGEAINISIYRIIQESLTNIAKHAKATEVDITLKLADDMANGDHVESTKRVQLMIRDNGQGFELESTRPGLGLLGMRERAAALNGEFVLASSSGTGVALRVTIPLEPKTRGE